MKARLEQGKPGSNIKIVILDDEENEIGSFVCREIVAQAEGWAEFPLSPAQIVKFYKGMDLMAQARKVQEEVIEFVKTPEYAAFYRR